jgi:hypothetical protein
MWLYVFGHEATHAVWTWFFGGRVKQFRATSRGGHVVITKTNFLVTLAPYFFPFYALVWMGLFSLGSWFWNWSAFLTPFHLVLGSLYAFHLSLTWHILQTHQPDLQLEGHFFSYVIIWLGNVLVLLVAIPCLSPQCSLIDTAHDALIEIRKLASILKKLVQNAIQR